MIWWAGLAPNGAGAAWVREFRGTVGRSLG